MTCGRVRAKVLRLSSTGGIARVAEWQTRTVQVRVSERTWRFNSSLAHSRPSLSGLGLLLCPLGVSPLGAPGVDGCEGAENRVHSQAAERTGISTWTLRLRMASGQLAASTAGRRIGATETRAGRSPKASGGSLLQFYGAELFHMERKWSTMEAWTCRTRSPP